MASMTLNDTNVVILQFPFRCALFCYMCPRCERFFGSNFIFNQTTRQCFSVDWLPCVLNMYGKLKILVYIFSWKMLNQCKTLLLINEIGQATNFSGKNTNYFQCHESKFSSIMFPFKHGSHF